MTCGHSRGYVLADIVRIGLKQQYNGINKPVNSNQTSPVQLVRVGPGLALTYLTN